MGFWSYLFPGDEGILADLFWSNQQTSSGITLKNQTYIGTSEEDKVNFAQLSLSYNPYQSEVYLLEGNDAIRTIGTSSGTNFYLGEGDDFFTALDGLRYSRIEGGRGDDTIRIKESLWDMEGLYRSSIDTGVGNDYILVEKEDRLADSRSGVYGGGIFAGDGDDTLIIEGNGLLVQSSGSLFPHEDGSTTRDGIINLGEGKDFLGIYKWSAPPPTGSKSVGGSPYLLNLDIDLGGGGDTIDLRSLDFSSSTGVLIKGGVGYDIAILPLGITSPPAWLQEFESFVYSPNNGNGTPGSITGNGAFQDGVTLTAPVVTGDPDGNAVNPNYAYQWSRNGNAIADATASTYVVPASGAGTYRVTITYTDAQGFTATLDSPNQVISGPNNQAPTDLTASTTAFKENITAGSTVATLGTTDPDSGNSFSYSLVSGTGSTDNAAFSISGNQLKINGSPDFETKSSYSIRLRTTDTSGLYLENSFVLTVNDLPELGPMVDLTFSSSTSTINDVTLGSTALGYAIQSGSGSPLHITFDGGKHASASNPGAGWSAIAAAAVGSGYELYWKNSASGQFVRWLLNSAGALATGALLSNAELLSAESSLSADLNADGSTGLAYTPGSTSIAGLNLGTTQLGYAIQSGSGSPLHITFDGGKHASASNPGAGWSAVAAAALGTGYELFWKNSVTGQYVRWLLDSNGNLSSGAILSTSELLLAETRLNTDLNADGSTGLAYTPGSSTIAGLNLGTTLLGYAIQSGSGSPLHITFDGGKHASASNPGAGWSAIAAAAVGSGYELYWKNSATGQFVRWLLNSAGALTTGSLLSNAELLSAETSLSTDLNADGFAGNNADSVIAKPSIINDYITTTGEVDRFPIDSVTGAIISASLTSTNPSLFPLIDLKASDGTLLKSSIAYNGNFADLGMFDLATGKAVLEVRTQVGATGDYSLEFAIATREEIKTEVIRLTNLERQKGGLNPLTRNVLLEQAAEGHVRDMDASDKYLAHTGSNGSTPQDRIKATGYKAGWVDLGNGSLRTISSENAASGQTSAAAVVDAWMNSPGHRAAIMDAATKEIGVGFEYDDQTGTTYWIQNFGYPWTQGMTVWF